MSDRYPVTITRKIIARGDRHRAHSKFAVLAHAYDMLQCILPDTMAEHRLTVRRGYANDNGHAFVFRAGVELPTFGDIFERVRDKDHCLTIFHK